MLRILNVDKPRGWTSFDVIRWARRQFQEKKAGHLGTLDPLATGVLPVFLDKATKLISLFNEQDKVLPVIDGLLTHLFEACSSRAGPGQESPRASDSCPGFSLTDSGPDELPSSEPPSGAAASESGRSFR